MLTQESIGPQLPKDYEQLINLLTVIVTDAILDFMVTRSLTAEQLLAQNRERLDETGEWIKKKLAELPPAIASVPPAVPDNG